MSSVIIAVFAAALLSYLLGSCNMAIMISKFHKAKDIRNFGSGNAGMTNMLRIFGKRAALFTFAGDFLKGAAAVYFSRMIFENSFFPLDIGYTAAFFAVLGHIFPLYFKFKGGKGVATSFGAMLMLNPTVFMTILVGLVPMFFVIRIVSAVSLCGAALYPVLTFLVLTLKDADILTVTLPNTVFSLMIAALTFYAHRENIARLRNGTENFFGDKKK
jgi:glycerol-3-phosphate acyltransferase PlsY